MKQFIDTVKIIWLRPKYITKTIPEKIGILKNKNMSYEKNIGLDYSQIKDYPDHVIEEMELALKQTQQFKHPISDTVGSVEYTLQEFLKLHPNCQLISVIEYEDDLCIVWRI